jgi:protein-S-isoprenylcysteine O-methyltransferase Ste14
MQQIPQIIIIVCTWVAFILYWAISALYVKKDVSSKKSWYWSRRGILIRFAIAIVLIIAAVSRGKLAHHIFAISAVYEPLGPVAASIGAALTVLGIALAIWARVHLGRNWSSHPTHKEHHELVTSGPYALVRHPIYTGILLAELGSSIGVSVWWLIPLVFGIYVFVRRVYKEERIMTELFPDTYPAYKKRTWALIPYIW